MTKEEIATYFETAAQNIRESLWGFAKVNAEHGLELLKAYRLLENEQYTGGPKT